MFGEMSLVNNATAAKATVRCSASSTATCSRARATSRSATSTRRSSATSRPSPRAASASRPAQGLRHRRPRRGRGPARATRRRLSSLAAVSLHLMHSRISSKEGSSFEGRNSSFRKKPTARQSATAQTLSMEDQVRAARKHLKANPRQQRERRPRRHVGRHGIGERDADGWPHGLESDEVDEAGRTPPRGAVVQLRTPPPAGRAPAPQARPRGRAAAS